MAYEIDYEDGCDYRRVKEEPDCYGCCDSGVISEDASNAYSSRWPWATADVVTEGTTNCPDCSPTPVQFAARIAYAKDREAEFAAAVARGEASYNESPF